MHELEKEYLVKEGKEKNLYALRRDCFGVLESERRCEYYFHHDGVIGIILSFC